MLLIIGQGGQDQSIFMARKLSLSQCIATDFEEPEICLDWFEISCPILQIRASGCAEYYSDEICDKDSLI
jgi:hypothetical protein